MKKGFAFIILLSFSFLFSSFYINYFSRNIYIKDFNDYDEVKVFNNYNNKKITMCYGTSYYCKKISYDIKGSVNTNKIGTYRITYIADYKDIHFSKVKKVKVVDRKKPVLTVEGNFEKVCPNGKVENVKISALDEYDGDLSSNVKYKVQGNKILYKVSDASGNIAKEEFDITIKDEQAPSLILNDDSTIYLGVGSPYKEPGYVAIDNCDGDITKNVVVTGNVDVSKKGTYELVYTIKDQYGNEKTSKRTIKVFEKNNYNPSAIGSKTVYLTFDDGPGKYTQKLLDILGKYNVKATFFVTGYDNRYNDLLTREYEEGHTVALHSYSHNYAIYSSVESYMSDLLQISDKVKEYTKHESKIIRFPGGSSNTISKKYQSGIMTTLTNKVNELGYRYFDWTIASGDAGDTKDTNKIIQNVTSKLKENELNVVLMHDIKSYSVDAVESIIQYGLANGYTFAPLTLESPDVHQRVNN